MTLLTVDLSDLAGKHGLDDHIIIRPDVFREKPNGGIVSTAAVRINLVASIEQRLTNAGF